MLLEFKDLTLTGIRNENRTAPDGTIYENRAGLVLSDGTIIRLIDKTDAAKAMLKKAGTAEGLLEKVVKRKGTHSDYYALDTTDVTEVMSIADLLA